MDFQAMSLNFELRCTSLRMFSLYYTKSCICVFDTSTPKTNSVVFDCVKYFFDINTPDFLLIFHSASNYLFVLKCMILIAMSVIYADICYVEQLI